MILPKGITNRGYSFLARLTYNGSTTRKEFRLDKFSTPEEALEQAISWLDRQRASLDVTKAGKTSKFKPKYKDLTQANLKEYLVYDEVTGVFTWLKSEAVCIPVGTQAGCLDNKGYRVVSLFGKNYKCHRLAWLYIYGTLPDSHIDHINRDTADNRIKNLRLASSMENQANTIGRGSNTGVKGVHYLENLNKYLAGIKKSGKIYQATFLTLQEATDWVRAKREELHGEFANHG
jgi:hypothetical protein